RRTGLEPHETHRGSKSTAAARRKAAGEDRGATQRHQAHASVDTVILQGTKCLLYYRLVSKTSDLVLNFLRVSSNEECETISTQIHLLCDKARRKFEKLHNA